MIRVLVVDDSAFNRLTLARILEEDSEVKVIGAAVDGEDGIKKILSLRPDVVTLDLEMPRMDGFAMLRWVMANAPTPVIVVSSREDDVSVFKALELGALDFVAKPSARASQALAGIKDNLLAKIHSVRGSKMANLRRRLSGAEEITVDMPKVAQPARSYRYDAVVIGASTGGPPALQSIFSRLPFLSLPIIVAQHMPAVFTRLFAERVNRLSSMTIKEAQTGERLVPGTIYVAPGGYQTRVERIASGDRIIRTIERSNADLYAPSVNMLFESAAKAYGARLMGVVLTGMGDDGKVGMQAIKQAGGMTLAESEDSAIVFGMPGESIRAGVVDKVASLEAMPEEIFAGLQEGAAAPAKA